MYLVEWASAWSVSSRSAEARFGLRFARNVVRLVVGACQIRVLMLTHPRQGIDSAWDASSLSFLQSRGIESRMV